MVKIISLNINGIKCRRKQEYFNQFLTSNRPDILALQETNIKKMENLEKEYEAIINNNVKNSRSGTIIIH